MPRLGLAHGGHAATEAEARHRLAMAPGDGQLLSWSTRPLERIAGSGREVIDRGSFDDAAGAEILSDVRQGLECHVGADGLAVGLGLCVAQTRGREVGRRVP